MVLSASMWVCIGGESEGSGFLLHFILPFYVYECIFHQYFITWVILSFPLFACSPHLFLSLHLCSPHFSDPGIHFSYCPKSLHFSPTCLISFAFWVLFSKYSFPLYTLFICFLFSLVNCHTKTSFYTQNGPHRSDNFIGSSHKNVIKNQKIWPCLVFLSRCCGSDFGSQLSKSCKHLLFPARLLFQLIWFNSIRSNSTLCRVP